MTGVYFSLFQPDKRPGALALLAFASAAGSITGVFAPDGLGFPNPEASGIYTEKTGFFLIALFLVFLLGLFRIGFFLVPSVLFVFSALVSASAKTLFRSGQALAGFQSMVPIIRLFAVFLFLFFLSTQAMLVSRSFPLTVKRHTRRVGAQRLFYFGEFILLSILAAAVFAALGSL